MASTAEVKARPAARTVFDLGNVPYYRWALTLPGLLWTGIRRVSSSQYFTWLPQDPKVQRIIDGVFFGSSVLAAVSAYMSAYRSEPPLSQDGFSQLAREWSSLTPEQRAKHEKDFRNTGWANLAQLVSTLHALPTKSFAEIERVLLIPGMIETFRKAPEFWVAVRLALLAEGERRKNNEGVTTESADFKILVFKISIKLHWPDCQLPQFNQQSPKVRLEIVKPADEASGSAESREAIDGVYVDMLSLLTGAHSFGIIQKVEGDDSQRRILLGATTPLQVEHVKEMLCFFIQGKQPPLDWLLTHLQMLDMFGMESFLYLAHRHLHQHHSRLGELGDQFSQEEIAKMLIETHPGNVKKLKATWEAGGTLESTNVLLAMSYAIVFGLKTKLNSDIRTFIRKSGNDAPTLRLIFDHAERISQSLLPGDDRHDMVQQWKTCCLEKYEQSNLHTTWTSVFEMPSDIAAMLIQRDHSHVQLDVAGKGPAIGANKIGFTKAQIVASLDGVQQEDYEDVVGFLKSDTCLALAQQIPLFFEHLCQKLAAREEGKIPCQLPLQQMAWKLFYSEKIANKVFEEKETPYITLKIVPLQGEPIEIEHISQEVLLNAGLRVEEGSLVLEEGQEPQQVVAIVRKLITSEKPSLPWLVEHYLVWNQLRCAPFLWELQRILMSPKEHDAATEEDIIAISRLFAQQLPFEIDEGWKNTADLQKSKLLISRRSLLPLMSLAAKGPHLEDLKTRCGLFMLQCVLPSMSHRHAGIDDDARMSQIVDKQDTYPSLFRAFYEHAVYLNDPGFVIACQDIVSMERHSGALKGTLNSAWPDLFEIPENLLTAANDDHYQPKVYVHVKLTKPEDLAQYAHMTVAPPLLTCRI